MGAVFAIDPLTDPRWDDFLREHPAAGLFHSAAWIEVTQRVYGYAPAHLAYGGKAGVEGLLPLVFIRSPLTGKRLVSMPYSGPSGPLGTSKQVAGALVETAIERARDLGCAYLKLQMGDRLPASVRGRLVETQPMVCSAVPLVADADWLWQNTLSHNMQKAIRRVTRKGVRCDIQNGAEGLETFYRLHIETHRKYGIPPQPRSLFRTMREVFLRRGEYWLQIASVDRRPIHAQLLLGFNRVLYAIYAGADYRFIDFSPAKVIDWSAMQLGCANGYRSLDLLQSDVGHAGLRSYKRRFGAIETPVFAYHYPGVGVAEAAKERMVRGHGRLDALARKTVTHLPTSVLTAMGPLVFRHMG